MKTEIVTVLDLGSTKVTCLAASPNGVEGIEVLAVETIPCKAIQRGSVTDLDEAARAIDTVIRRVAQALPPDSIQNIVVGVGGSHVEGVSSQGLKPIVPRARHITYQDVHEVINHSRSIVLPPDREQIQALPREFRVDGQRDIRNAIGMSGAKLEVETYLVTGQTTAIQNIERAVSMGGRKIDQLVSQPLASGLGVLTKEEMDLGVVVVDIGGGLTSIGIFSKGSMAFSASLPIGSRHVTSDLSNLLKTSPEEAERLKVIHGAALAKVVAERESVDVQQIGQPVPRPLQRRVLCEIIESRMRELATMVGQQIEKSGLQAMLPAGVVLTGGGSLMPGTEKLFEETLKHQKVRTVEPIPVPGLPTSPGLATAVGLARFALVCYDELGPANGIQGWRNKVRSLFSLVTGK
jgi:cell division protein FtsA